MGKNNKPLHFLVFKIIGFIGIAVFISGIILTCNGVNNFENNNFMIGGILTCVGMFVGVVFLVGGFRPEIAKLSAKSAKYIQQQNKSELSDIAETGADITSNALKKSAKAFKEGLCSKKFCKFCGAEIDEDSVFCNKCGKEQ